MTRPLPFTVQVVGREAQFAIDNENITGLTLWQFNDIKVGVGCAARAVTGKLWLRRVGVDGVFSVVA